MVSSTKKEVSHDPREIETKQRRSSRLNRKHPGSHSRKSFTSTEFKSPKIVKSYSSTKMLDWKHSTVLTKVALRSLKVMKIMRTDSFHEILGHCSEINTRHTGKAFGYEFTGKSECLILKKTIHRLVQSAR
jgi:hypothetical protein